MTTVITKTIGPSGRDYASFIAAEADVTNIAIAEFGSTDLVANDGAIVFEADAGTYTGRVFIQSTLTTDATRNVTYRPAAGSEHGGDKSSGVIVYSTNVSFIVHDPHTVLDGLVIPNTGTYCVNTTGSATGAQYRNCIFDGSQGTTFGVVFLTGGTVADPIVVENCVGYTVNVNNFYTRGIVDSNIRIVNCTAISSGVGLSLRLEGHASTSLDVEVVNMLSLASRNYLGSSSHTVTGSNNFGGATDPFPVAIQGSPYPITATTDTTAASTGSQAIYVDETGQLVDVDGNDITGQGIGPASNSDVPTTGIVGETRSGATTLPGAFATLKSLAPAPIIPDAIDYGMPGGYSVASILFEDSTTCYLNGVQKTVLYPGQDLSLPLFRSTSADANKDLVIVPNTLSNKQIILHNYSWGHAGLDTAKPLYEPMLSWFTVYGSAVEGDGIALTTPRYIGDMDRTTPLEVALPPGKSLALSFVSFPSTPPNTTLAAALTVTYEIVGAGGSSTFVNNILDN